MRKIETRLSDQHVVILINYLRRHHVLAFKEFAKKVDRLTILVSTDMEKDRHWTPSWDELNVIVQRNSTLTLRRSSGFDEKNFIHFPWDTISQLRRLKPDVVLSYEMGARTLFSTLFRRLHRQTPLVLVGNMSNHIEGRRGWLRKTVRGWIRNSVDLATYNGPGCKRYLLDLGFDESRLVYFPYCYDPDKTYQGEKEFEDQGIRKILFCSALSERKAILPFAEALQRFCVRHPERELKFVVAGDGPLREQVANLGLPNLAIDLLGNCSIEQLRECYREADVCAFPSLGDEWGLVPIEAWVSGVPVLGSQFAQSVEYNCQSGKNGWIFDPTNPSSIDKAVHQALAIDGAQLHDMSKTSREIANKFSAEISAIHLGRVVDTAIRTVNGASRSSIQVRERQDARPKVVNRRGVATLSLDLDNKWSYLKSHNNPSWESHPGYLDLVVPRILAILNELNLRITFFVVGQDAVIRENSAALKMISDGGHEIGNHTFHHEPCLHLYTPGQLDRELQLAEDAIQRVTGQRTVGFRGPGFSLSDQTLNTLARRGYRYDCTMFPTYLSPLARTYYFMTGTFTKKQVQEKQALFGKFSDGFMPNSPYLWQTESGDLLEIPVTTFPGIKTPIHATYLHYLATYSPWAANKYLQSALAACNVSQLAPSLLLHPLDFLGNDDTPELKFFPGMKEDSKTKLQCIRQYLEMYAEKYEIMTLQQFAAISLEGHLDRRSAALARTGLS